MNEERSVVYAEMQDDGIKTIFFNQPEKKNAISAEMMQLLRDFLLEADRDSNVRVILLRGVGDIFSSGGDLSQSSPEDVTPENARRTLRFYLDATQAMRCISTPVITMVDGFAVGGAFSLVLASDLVCASSRAVFIPAFCQIGIIPEMGMMKYLTELVGSQRAKEIIFLGGKFSSEKMHDLGLVNRVFPAETLEQDTLAFAKELAAMPDTSIQIAKGIMNSLVDSNLNVLLEAESTASPFCTTTKAYAKTVERFKK